MCSHYEATTDPERYRRHFGVDLPVGVELHDLWPGYGGSFIRRPRPKDHAGASPEREAMAGVFGLIPHWAMLHHDTGVLCAPTAFGKTVTAAAMIARRGVNTLVLVHRTELLKQWQERLQAFLDVGKGVVGTIGGGKSRPTGKIDIAVMQSVSRQGEVNPLVEHYGHPALLRMWDKRQRGYRAMGYRVGVMGTGPS